MKTIRSLSYVKNDHINKHIKNSTHQDHEHFLEITLVVNLLKTSKVDREQLKEAPLGREHLPRRCLGCKHFLVDLGWA